MGLEENHKDDEDAGASVMQEETDRTWSVSLEKNGLRGTSSMCINVGLGELDSS